jgi:RNA polymerase sigma-70 factor, ECF subfamily
MSTGKSVQFSMLIERARQGDAECRDRLFGLCRSYLGFVARSQVETWLRRKVDASDLVQETMLEACRDLERFEGHTEKEWLAWLRKILAHNAADFVRRYRGTEKRAAGREVSSGSRLARSPNA